jgi:hypothetical protein
MLCSSLAETHSVEISAKVILEFVKESTGPGASVLTPSLSQWHSLVKTCSGVLAHTSFGVVAEQLMSLADQDRTSKRWMRKSGDPVDIAKALHALAEVSRDAAFAITFTGTVECGWLAAIAHWFFELDTEIRNDQGNVLFSSCRKEQPPRVLIIYSLEDSNHIHTIGKSYFVKSIDDILQPFNSEGGAISGRVKWETALRQTFGRSARQLLEQRTIFGRLIGSAARVFQAISFKEDEAEFAENLYRDNCFYGDQSYGRGFLNIALHRLPELSPLGEKGEPLLEVSCSDAIGEYLVCLAKLVQLCSCEQCADEDYRHQIKGRNESNSAKIFCLPVLAQFIIRLVRELTLMDFDDKLLPSRYGLEASYMRHEASLGPHKESHDDTYNYYIQALLTKYEPNGLLQDAIVIFAGVYNPILLRSAIVCRGLCFYFGVLRELSPDVETIIRIHIVPGIIEGSTGRTFEKIEDHHRVRLEPTISYSAKMPVAAPQLKASRGACSPELEAQLAIDEDVESMKLHYRVSAAGENMLCTFTPHQLMTKVLHASGRVQCKRIGCRKLSNQNIGAVAVEGEGRLNPLELSQQGYSIILRQVAGSSLGRCLALFLDVRTTKGKNPVPYDNIPSMEIMGLPKDTILTSDPTNQVGMVLQNDECFPCCIRAALKLHRDHEVICVVQK